MLDCRHMATMEERAFGSFCWIELGTTDPAAAKAFYASLFGWGAKDFPMGPSPNEVYSIFNLDGRDAAGLYTLTPEMRQRGVPSHWMLYVCVSSADDAVAKAAAAGGKVMAPPFDVADFGRMAVIQDPAGAVFSVWQAKQAEWNRQHMGIGLSNAPGAMCWADLNTPDAEAAKRFYEALFGWQVTSGDMDSSGYLVIRNGEQSIGGIRPAPPREGNAPPSWLLYFMVPDCASAAAKAKQLGARAYVERVSMDKVGTWSVIADPQGAVLALFEPARPV